MKKFLAILLFAAVPCLAEVDRKQCALDTETELCEDLTQAKVQIHTMSRSKVRNECGYGNWACAKLRLSSTRGAVCDVYVSAGRQRKDLIHELNHCRGWDHGHFVSSHRRPWGVMEAVTTFANLNPQRPVLVKQQTAKQKP